MTTTPVSALPGVNVLLMGPAGTGKTHSIGTLVDAGLDVHYMAFENGAESLLGYWTDRGKPVPENLHIMTVKAAKASWLEMAEQAKLINTLSYEALKKSNDPNRSKYDQFEQFLRTFNEVTEDNKPGVKHGSVDSWGTDKALVIDGLTGLGAAAMQAVIGGKADRDQKDWGLAQNLLENFLRRLTSDCRCHKVIIAHVERETDQVLGGVKLMVSTLGAKLAPKIPAMFSDVALAVKNVDKFSWDTANPQADLKNRNLPLASNIRPDFGQIIDKWKSRGGVLEVPA
ncbi:AAA domain [Bacteriophage sp.]|nr:AAA domain [Bacteriophage sp.]